MFPSIFSQLFLCNRKITALPNFWHCTTLKNHTILHDFRSQIILGTLKQHIHCNCLHIIQFINASEKFDKLRPLENAWRKNLLSIQNRELLKMKNKKNDLKSSSLSLYLSLSLSLSFSSGNINWTFLFSQNKAKSNWTYDPPSLLQ